MNILLGKTQLCVIILVFASFGSNISGSVDFSLRVRKQRDRQDIYTVRCIDSSSKSFLALRAAVGEVPIDAVVRHRHLCSTSTDAAQALSCLSTDISQDISSRASYIRRRNSNQSIDIQIPCSKANYLDLKGCRFCFLRNILSTYLYNFILQLLFTY